MRKLVKIKGLLLVMMLALAVLSVLPSFAAALGEDAEAQVPRWLADNYTRKFNLGLDLQGGLHLEYSVAVDEALEHKLDRVVGDIEADFHEKKPDVDVTIERVGIDRIKLTFDDPADIAQADDDVLGKALDLLAREDEDSKAGIIILKRDEEQITADRTAVIGQALDTVRRRVDSMGIAEPNIYPKNRQVVIELPGLTDTSTEMSAASEEVAIALQNILKTAGADQVTIGDVEQDPGAFRITITGENAREFLAKALGEGFLENEKGQFLIDERIAGDLEILADERGAQADAASVTLSLTEDSRDTILEESSDFRRLLRVIERAAVLEMHMVDDETLFGDTGEPYLKALVEAGMVTQGMGISVNEMSDYGREGGVSVKAPYAFFAKNCKVLKRFFNGLPAKWRLPSSHFVAYGHEGVRLRRGSAEPDFVCRTHIVKSRADITGDRIVTANVDFKSDTGVPVVSASFDKLGAVAFDDMSGNNVGRRMAIIMDDLVASDPVFNERISGGNVQISLGAAPGGTVRDQANDLVKVLKSGSLPARLQKEFEIRVGADLGKDSVERGLKAFLVGLGLVIIFMAIYYRRSGLVAVFALVMNMTLVLAAMAFFQATLTLPGIAGIVLTIGMAVDANVIIFERVREYLREGYKARAAIEAGYDRAFTTILDSQLTTAIAGIVLWQFGSGPIRGFAITLLIGIATSIFTGVFATRVFFDWQTNRRGFDKVSI